MSLKDTLTNEKLNDCNQNPFSLVNYAIKIAKKRIAKGDGMDLDLATDILEKIADGHEILPEQENDEDFIESDDQLEQEAV